MMPPTTSEPSTISIGALSPTARDQAGSEMLVAADAGDQQRDQAEAVGDHVAGALAQPVPDQHADGGAEQHGGHVDDGADAREHHVLLVGALRARGRSPRLPNWLALGVISHLGPVRELSGAPRAGPTACTPAVTAPSPATGWEGCPHVPQPGAASATRPPTTPPPSSRSGAALARPAPPGPAPPRTPRRRRPPRRPDRRRPGPAAARRPHRRRTSPAPCTSCAAPLSPVHSETAVYVMHLQVHRGPSAGTAWVARCWRPRSPGPRRRTPRTSSRRPRSPPATPTASWPGSGSAQIAVVRGATVPALRAKLPVEPPAAARVGSRSHRNVGQVLVQRRSMRRSQARALLAARRPSWPPVRGGGSRLGWRTCPTSLPSATRPSARRRGCCCSTATRWPTARSSRCRWRTSRPPPGQHTNAVYGFTSMLINVLRDEQPTHLGGRLRRVPADLPLRGVRRVQGQPLQVARRVPAARCP